MTGRGGRVAWYTREVTNGLLITLWVMLVVLVGGTGGTAQAAEPVDTSSVFLAGTGKVLGGGETARLDASISCPKGETWSVSGGVFAFAEIGDDDTYASAEPESTGRCTGRLQKVKITITAYYNPPIPANCSAEYSVDFLFSDGSLVHVDHGVSGASNGPQICLT